MGVADEPSEAREQQSLESLRPGLASLSLRTIYRTNETDPATHFYAPCLAKARVYKRAVGYFRSSVFLIVGDATIEFAKRGGRIRMICAPTLSKEDIESIENGYTERTQVAANRLARQIDELLADETTSYRTKVLATLISVGAMDIRLAIRPTSWGMYHEKIGVFADDVGNRVSFIGSANETWNGWHHRGNVESVEVFCKWRGGIESDRVQAHDEYFEKLWNGSVNDVETTEFPDAIRRKLIAVAAPSLDHLSTSGLAIEIPRRRLLKHQADAISAWTTLGRRGILQHATGSGKTFTALCAIKEHVTDGRPALVLVPSQILLSQWAEEIAVELPDATVLRAGAGYDKWKEFGRLRSFTSGRGAAGRIVLATMQTASTEGFLASVRVSEHLLLVADEVHQIGSAQNSNILTIETEARLGLSATPTRFGDPEGTSKVFGYFGAVVPPVITLQDAIAAKRLVEYEYFPHPVYLTAEEVDEWAHVTKQIIQNLPKQKKNTPPTPIGDKVKMLMIRRARIAKKAKNKQALALRVLKRNFRPDDRWLVYCEDVEQLKGILHGLLGLGLPAAEYHSAMAGDRIATLDWLRDFGGIVVSVKCLDEGVDIPAVTHALILASSQNPRQFIQRRGRVLRKAPDKNQAFIHDAIVVPVSIEDEPSQVALLRSELARSLSFATSAINKSAAAELHGIAAHLGVNIGQESGVGVEDDNEYEG